MTRFLELVMPVLDTGISRLHVSRVKQSFVYIMSNRKGGTLYVGVTSELVQRVYQHRNGLCEGFTKRYGLTRLIYVEAHDEMYEAIQREKNIKHWPREWKVDLIEKENPDWDDLFDLITQ